jgi:hypothetical protein
MRPAEYTGCDYAFKPAGHLCRFRGLQKGFIEPLIAVNTKIPAVSAFA